MVLRTEQVASPAWARRNDADWYENSLRHYPTTVHELGTARSWRRLFRKQVVPTDATARLAALHPRGPIYHDRDRDNDVDRLVILTPVCDVSPALVESNPLGRRYYAPPLVSVVLEENPARVHDSLDLAETDLTVAEGLEQFRPVARRERYERDVPEASAAVEPVESS